MSTFESAHVLHRDRLEGDVGNPYANPESAATETPRESRAPRTNTTRRATLIAVLTFSAITLWTLRAILPAALLGAWVAGVTEPLSVRIARRFGSRTRAASLLTLTLILSLAAIGSALVLPVVSDVAMVLRAVHRAIASAHPMASLPHMLQHSGEAHDPAHPSVLALVRDVGPIASEALATAAAVAVQIVTFVATAYYLSIDGRRLQAGIERVSPLGPENTRQFLTEFIAVGRGIALSMGLAASATACALGATYVAIGVPRPMLFTAFTFVAAMLPIGAPIVWIPIGIWLLTQQRPGATFVLVCVGVLVVSGFVDHLLRPWLVRFGKLSLHPLLTLFGLFGGILAFGAWGTFLGPLLIAMTATAMRVHAERPILARRSLVPGERVTLMSIAPAPAVPAAIPPEGA